MSNYIFTSFKNFVYQERENEMNIRPTSYKTNFGRAFTTEETIAYSKLLNESRNNLGLKDTSSIIFDFNVPSKDGQNPAIGTTWSSSMIPFINFVKNMTGMNSIQLAPQGKIKQGNTSPYSGTTFAFGEHIIDLAKLTTSEYGNLLPISLLLGIDKKYPKDRQTREYKTDYPFVLGTYNEQGIQEKSLQIAFKNFKTKVEEENPSIKKLNKEFSIFKEKNAKWLEKEALFISLTKLYGNDDFETWSEIDKNLFSQLTSEESRQERISELKTQFKNDIEFEEFKQFIADKQQKESHKTLNEEDIKLYGDCLLGFSRSEMWANKDCFRKNLYYGGPDPNCPETNYIQTWGLPALDYTKLGECSSNGDTSKLGIVGQLLFDKYTTFFERYDGIRVDAAWQFITPFIYQETNGNFEEIKMLQVKRLH